MTWQLALAIAAVLSVVLAARIAARRAEAYASDHEESLRQPTRDTDPNKFKAWLSPNAAAYEPAYIEGGHGLGPDDFGLRAVKQHQRRDRLQKAYSTAFRAGVWITAAACVFFAGKASNNWPAKANAAPPAIVVPVQRAVHVSPARPIYCEPDYHENCLVCQHQQATGGYTTTTHCPL